VGEQCGRVLPEELLLEIRVFQSLGINHIGSPVLDAAEGYARLLPFAAPGRQPAGLLIDHRPARHGRLFGEQGQIVPPRGEGRHDLAQVGLRPADNGPVMGGDQNAHDHWGL
jgi:hypothetical protein